MVTLTSDGVDMNKAPLDNGAAEDTGIYKVSSKNFSNNGYINPVGYWNNETNKLETPSSYTTYYWQPGDRIYSYPQNVSNIYK